MNDFSRQLEQTAHSIDPTAAEHIWEEVAWIVSRNDHHRVLRCQKCPAEKWEKL